MQDWIAELIKDTHKEVNRMRMKKGLKPHPFDKVVDHVVEPYAIVRSVMSNNVDHGFKTISNVECACGCGNLLTFAWMYGGRGGREKPRKYISGHSPKKEANRANYVKYHPDYASPQVHSVAENKHQVINHQASVGNKEHTNAGVSYSPQNMRQAAQRMLDLNREQEKLVLEELQELDEKRNKKNKELQVLQTELINLAGVVDALDALIDKREKKVVDIAKIMQENNDPYLHRDFGNQTLVVDPNMVLRNTMPSN